MFIFSLSGLKMLTLSGFCGFSKTFFVKACEMSSSSEHQTSSSSLSSREGQKIRKPLVSIFFSVPLFSHRILQRVGKMKLGCVTPTQQQELLSFFFFLPLSLTAISVASDSVFLCHTLTDILHLFVCPLSG